MIGDRRLLVRWWRDWRLWVLVPLALQFALLQLLTGVEYWDAPRNLHWGLYVLEQPRFLLNAEDIYDRIKGFPPEPPSLAPAGLATDRGSPLHPWWGPLYPLLFAGVWWLTGSYTVLQLVVPVAAGAVVFLTYAFGARYFSRRTGFLAALLLALFPIYREHGPLSFVEPLSALLLAGALWAFLARRSYLAALLGSLAVLGKIDMIPLYFGTIALTALLSWRDRAGTLPLRHTAICLGVPLLFLVPWLYLIYVAIGRPTTVGGGPQLGIFMILAPMMVEQLFTAQLSIGVLTLAVFAAAIGLALRCRGDDRALYRLLAIWLALGCLVLLVYSAAPGASNNPRVIIPELLPLCLLAAAGFERMAPRWRLPGLVYLLAFFLAADGSGILYQALEARQLNAAMPVWEMLRQEPRGYVMTEYYWHAALYARQPATWFEEDEAFQNNILRSLEHFRRYIDTHSIRYIVLPRDEASPGDGLNTPFADLYRRLPFGRPLTWRSERLTAPEVRAYLERQFPRRVVGDFVVFTIGTRR
jgi:hypothetical protein